MSIGNQVRRFGWYFALLLVPLFLGLTSIAQAETSTQPAALNLSPEESAWLAAHPVIRLGIDANYGPYSYLDEQGQFQGVVREYLAHIERSLNIRFEIISNLDWPQLMDAVREKRIDAVATVAHLKEREAFLEFSSLYLLTPLVIMTRDNTPQLRSLKELPSLNLALVNGYASSKEVMALYPAIRPILVTAPIDGLRAVASGMVDAYVGVLGVNTFLARRHGLSNLKVNAAFNMGVDGQRFGVRKDWPQLARLLDKALAAIPAETRENILQRWIPIQAANITRLSKPTLVARLFPWLLGLIGLAVLGYLVLLLWNHQLKRELARRQRELLASTERLRAAESLAHVGNWQYSVADGDIQWSDETFRIFGLAPQSLQISYEWLIAHVHPDDRAWHDAYLHSMLDSRPGEAPPEGRYRLIRDDGEERTVKLQVHIEYESSGKPLTLFGTLQDISDQVKADRRLTAMNRLYRVLSGINEAIVRLNDPQVLFDEACRIAVEIGGFRMAWLGMMDAESREVRPLAHAGVEDQYLKNLHISLGEDAHARGPTGTALRAGENVVCNDIANDPRMAPWRESALAQGYRASAAFPIRIGGKVCGAFNLYADSIDFFDAEEVRLLNELAQDIGFALDYIEVERARETLNRRMVDLLESMSDGFVSLDRQWRYQYVNRKAGEMFGRPAAALLGKNIWREFPESVDQPFHQAYEQAMLGGEMSRLEDYYTPWNRWFENRIYPTQDGISIFFTDITERKQAEQALRDSEERLRLALNAAKQGLYDLDLRTGEALVSPEYARMLGYDPETFHETNAAWRERLHPDDQARVYQIYEGYIAGRIPEYRMEFRQQTLSGDWKWILSLGKVQERDSDGQPLRMLGTHTDITAIKLAEAALREQEEFFRLITENMGDMVAVLDNAGRRLYNSPSYQTLFGSTEDLMGTDSFAEIHPDDREQVRKTFLDTVRTGNGHRMNYRFVLADGSFRDIESQGGVIKNAAGEVERVVVVSRDISERKRLEDEIHQLNVELEERVQQRTSELATANKELETFTYSVSHDLKAPLRGIDGYSRLLLEDHLSQLDDEGRLFLGNVRHGVDQMSELIEDLLAYSRMERRDLRGIPLHLAQLVEKLLAERQAEIQAKGMQIQIELDDVVARADQDGLVMVLRNLIDNAIKFSRDSQPPKLAISATLTENRVTLAIQDNGIGFDMQFHERIFDIFQRLQRAEDYPGTGVGLAIVRKAVQRMNGRIWAVSEPGQGATFYLELPR